MRSLFRAFVLSALSLVLAACEADEAPQIVVLPAPAAALAVTALGEDRVAVLAGGPRARGVFILSEPDGRVLSSFGVNGDASGIAAVSPAGPLLLSVAREHDGASIGAVESWSPSGKRIATTPLAGAAREIVLAPDGLGYVLVSPAHAASAIVAFDPKTGGTRATHLPDDASHLAACEANGDPILAMTLGRVQTLASVSLRTGTIRRDPNVGGIESCTTRGSELIALQNVAGASNLATFDPRTLTQTSARPAPSDLVALAPQGTRLLALTRTSKSSALHLYPESFFTDRSEKGASKR